MGKALEGVRVLDLGRYISGPFSGMLLADMGAEVIRVEKPGGDQDRTLRPFVNGKSLYTSTFSRNKKCITLNFRSEEGRQLLYRLVEKSDVIISNFRAGVLEKMGLGYPEVQKLNPGLVMACISGFGQEGKHSHRTAFDGAATAMSGVMYENFVKDVGPRGFGTPVADVTTGYVNALAIVMALYQREKTGKGQFIDTAMVDCMVPYLETLIPTFAIEGVTAEPGYRNGGDPTSAPANIYRAKDGFIYIHAGSNVHYSILCELVDNDELKQEKYQDRQMRRQEAERLEAIVGHWVAQMGVDEAEELLGEAGIPVAKVNTVGDLMVDDYAASRGQIVWIDMPGAGKVPYAGSPLKMSDSPVESYAPGHDVGQDNRQVYASLLGLEEQTIDDYIASGTI